MKCQRCGAEIGEGKLYCSSCGQEVQIVPDFEPEVEHTMNQAMDHILKDVFHGEGKNKNLAKKAGHERKHYYYWIVVLLIISCVILLLVFGYMNFTSDYQIRRGNYYFKLQEYTSALKHYEKAELIDPENAEIALYLAECYEAMDKMAGYEANLTKVIQNENASEEYLKLAYMRLASLYLRNDEYQKIAKLLKFCNDVEVIEKFGKYQPQLPEFSHDTGEYSDIIPLKIYGGDNGMIYYTTDGTDPTAESKVYKSPIFLDKGEHIIKAIYVNEFGVTSEVITAKFKIKF